MSIRFRRVSRRECFSLSNNEHELCSHEVRDLCCMYHRERACLLLLLLRCRGLSTSPPRSYSTFMRHAERKSMTNPTVSRIKRSGNELFFLPTLNTLMQPFSKAATKFIVFLHLMCIFLPPATTGCKCFHHYLSLPSCHAAHSSNVE